MTEPLPAATQRLIGEITRTTWDVIVLGAGPAGGAAAASLASRGIAVLLVDRARFPREKVCGDALVPEAMEELQKIGLFEQVCAHGKTLPGYTLVSPSGSSLNLDHAVTLLPRKILDTLIAGKAVANGAVFAQAHFQGAMTLPDGSMECAFDGKKYQSQVLIVATGADRTPTRILGLPPKSKPEGVAIRRYYRSPGGPDRAYFFLKEAFIPGYAWIFPMGDGYYNVGCGRFLAKTSKANASLATSFENFLTEDPVARKLVSQAVESTPLRGASFRCGMETTEDTRLGRILLAGEAIGTTIPGWGEGISKAMETGLLAAEVTCAAIQGGDFSKLADYPRRLASEIKPKITKHAWVAACFSRTWSTNLLVAVASKMPGKFF